MASLILRSVQRPRVACSSKLPCLGGQPVNSVLPGSSVCQVFLYSLYLSSAGRRQFNRSSVLYLVGFLYCIVAQGKREMREVIKLNWILILTGFFHLQLSDVYLYLQFSGKIKITQGRTSKSHGLLDLEESSEILTVGLVDPQMIKKCGGDSSTDYSGRNAFHLDMENGWLVSEGNRQKRS